MRFKPHDFQKPYKPRSDAQCRQVRVFRLCGLYYHSYSLTGWRGRLFRWLIDQELAHVYGVETQTDRHNRQRREMDLRLAESDAQRQELDDLIPF